MIIQKQLRHKYNDICGIIGITPLSLSSFYASALQCLLNCGSIVQAPRDPSDRKGNVHSKSQHKDLAVSSWSSVQKCLNCVSPRDQRIEYLLRRHSGGIEY